MLKSTKIRVMHSFKPLSRVLTTFNAENFHDNNPRQILNAIIFAAVFIVFLVGIASNFWLCYTLKFDLIETAVPLPVLLCDIQTLMMFVSMILVNRTISSTIERLQEICEKRMYSDRARGCGKGPNCNIS